MSKFLEDEVKERGLEVVTRFPPEPNGYMHLGHAKALSVSYNLAQQHGGIFHLRMDDSNPDTERQEYVDAFLTDIEWLGYDYEGPFYASDYFYELDKLAESMTIKGLAYVCTCSEEEVATNRGTVKTHGTPCECRNRGWEENHEMFSSMLKGEYLRGEAILRAKIDLTSPNMKMRDPIMYRIKNATHYRVGFNHAYPLYDFVHGLSDSIEGITFSICTLEFDNNRELYDWYVKNSGVEHTANRQYEMGRDNLEFATLSKRRILALIEEGKVSGWDDPRLATIAGFRNRGIPASAVRRLVEESGISRSDNKMIELAKFEDIIREELDPISKRIMGVIDPILLVVDGMPDATVKADYWPRNFDESELRDLSISDRLWIDRSDFAISPPGKWRRLAPGRIVRLKYGAIIECTGYETDNDGNVTQVNARFIPGSLGGGAPDGVKPKGTIHWVDAKNCLHTEFRTYKPLFTDPMPKDNSSYDPESMIISAGVMENLPVKPGDHYQFERTGFGIITSSHVNMTAALRSGYKRK